MVTKNTRLHKLPNVIASLYKLLTRELSVLIKIKTKKEFFVINSTIRCADNKLNC